MNIDRLQELAAGYASGELDAAEQAEFHALLQAAPPAVRAQTAQIMDASALTGLILPRATPSSGLRERLLKTIQPPKPTPELFEFLQNTGDAGWLPLKVPGAFVKLLSIQKEKGYAVVLGKLDPQTCYPPHSHIGAEQIYILSGDLKIGDVHLKAGDFHNAKAGSTHGMNYSEGGCTIMAIVSTEDLATLM